MGAGIQTRKYIVQEGETVSLSNWQPADTSGFKGTEEEALEESRKLTLKLERLQEVLFAEHKRKVLIVLQAMDTGGKDGTIKKVFEGVNPQGVRVAHFQKPTPDEADHDFLWRVHRQVPGNGEMVIFNRSHYEDVLVERVHGLVSKETWVRRYKDIRHFEKLLHEEGTAVMKFFLYIDRAEQKRRLHERMADPTKRWKFSVFDVKESVFWSEYMRAYEEALQNTSTHSSPWYVIPADKKWFRDLLVSSIIVERLERLRMRYPKASADLKSMEI
jgi:PPK2 family polyphosphate:nucleotide phosphotransferase